MCPAHWMPFDLVLPDTPIWDVKIQAKFSPLSNAEPNSQVAETHWNYQNVFFDNAISYLYACPHFHANRVGIPLFLPVRKCEHKSKKKEWLKSVWKSHNFLNKIWYLILLLVWNFLLKFLWIFQILQFTVLKGYS